MSLISTITTKVSKFALYFWHVLLNTPDVLSVLSKLSPQTIAAVLAVFYDIVKFFTTEAATTGAAIADKNFGTALTDILSSETQTLLAQIITDAKTLGTVIANDIAELKKIGSTENL